jgi:hypothetical protein
VPKSYDGEKTASSTNVAGKTGSASVPRLSPCTSINSMWIKDLNIRPETLKLVQQRKGNTVELIGIGNHFNRTQMSQQLRKGLTNRIT